MFDVIQEGNFMEYTAVSEIQVLPFSRVIHMQPVRVYAKLVDGQWQIIGQKLLPTITVTDELRVNPQTMALDPAGEPAYAYLDAAFKPMIEAFAVAYAAAAAAQQPEPIAPPEPQPQP